MPSTLASTAELAGRRRPHQATALRALQVVLFGEPLDRLVGDRLAARGVSVRVPLCHRSSPKSSWAIERRSPIEWIASLGVGPRGAGVVSALTRVATYAGDLDLVSADAAVSQLQLALEGNVVYLDGGWQSLVDGLVAAAASGGARVLAGERATVLQAGTDGAFDVRTSERTLRAASVVVAGGSPAAARALLPHAPPWELGAPATAACLDLGLRRMPATMVAYGLDQPLYFSTHSPKAHLAPTGGAVAHVMRYGARTSSEDRAQLWALARRCGPPRRCLPRQRGGRRESGCGTCVAPASCRRCDAGTVNDAAEVFATERPRLLGLAYRILASYADAEDVVQEAWIRWQGVDHETIERPAARSPPGHGVDCAKNAPHQHNASTPGSFADSWLPSAPAISTRPSTCSTPTSCS